MKKAAVCAAWDLVRVGYLSLRQVIDPPPKHLDRQNRKFNSPSALCAVPIVHGSNSGLNAGVQAPEAALQRLDLLVKLHCHSSSTILSALLHDITQLGDAC